LNKVMIKKKINSSLIH